jgi:hypothetical protein
VLRPDPRGDRAPTPTRKPGGASIAGGSCACACSWPSFRCFFSTERCARPRTSLVRLDVVPARRRALTAHTGPRRRSARSGAAPTACPRRPGFAEQVSSTSARRRLPPPAPAAVQPPLIARSRASGGPFEGTAPRRRCRRPHPTEIQRPRSSSRIRPPVWRRIPDVRRLPPRRSAAGSSAPGCPPGPAPEPPHPGIHGVPADHAGDDSRPARHRGDRAARVTGADGRPTRR